MNYLDCPLYKVTSKRSLKLLLHIKRDVYLETSFINSKIKVYFNGRSRLIESPDADIKAIQRNILSCLTKIELPEYVFYGVKKRSFSQMEQLHANKRFTFCADISKFFYNTRRNNVYNFYRNILCTSPDVAEILSDYSAINLELKNFCGDKRIKELVTNKKICHNHLIAGAPQSAILSFLVNIIMFEELNSLAKENNLIFSVYADDLYFSSDTEIDNNIIEEIKSIVKMHKFNIAEEKTKYYEKQI